MFAAVNLQSGAIEGSLRRHHGSQESKAFLDQLDAAIPADLAVPLVLDNCATHKAPPMNGWLVKHPRFRLHFAPASTSWRNFVERWAAELTTKKLQRTARHSVMISHRYPGRDRGLVRSWAPPCVDEDRRPDTRLQAHC